MPKRVLDVGQCGPDHSSIRSYLTRNFDCEVVQVDDAAGALAELKGGQFDLVLVNRKLDCRLLGRHRRDPHAQGRSGCGQRAGDAGHELSGASRSGDCGRGDPRFRQAGIRRARQRGPNRRASRKAVSSSHANAGGDFLCGVRFLSQSAAHRPRTGSGLKASTRSSFITARTGRRPRAIFAARLADI